MTERKPKVEERRGSRRPGVTRCEFTTNVAGLEMHTFDIGHAKYAAKFKKSLEEIANYVQREYKGGPDIGRGIRELRLPTLQLPAMSADPNAQGLMFLWQGVAMDMRKRIAQLNENKQGKSSEMLSPTKFFVRSLSPVFCILGLSHQNYFYECYHLDLLHSF